MLKTWIERWPERLDYQLQALRTAGIPFERDEQAWGYGVFRLRLWPTVYGQSVSLIAEFPDFYPYVRFEVSAPELTLPHHQNPFEKYLCLLGRSSEHWNVSDTVADVLTEQLPKLHKSAESDNPEVYRDLEEEQAEPITTYYGYDAIIVADGAWQPTDEHGDLTIGIEPSIVNVRSPVLRAAVLQVQDGTGHIRYEAPPGLRRAYHQRMPAHWVRLKNAPRAGLRAGDGAGLALKDSRWPCERCA